MRYLRMQSSSCRPDRVANSDMEPCMHASLHPCRTVSEFMDDERLQAVQVTLLFTARRIARCGHYVAPSQFGSCE